MKDLSIVNRELIPTLQSSLYPGASDSSVMMVLQYCAAAGLDPMQKPVHIVPIWDSKACQMRDVVMPGVGLYRIQASRSGQCAGISEPEFGPDVNENIGGIMIKYPAWCRVTVRRMLPSGHIADFTATERWVENYAVKGGKEKSIAPNTMWMKRPYAQLAKCAEAQALRKAFPEIGAAPTAEEMEGKDLYVDAIDSTVVPQEPVRQALEQYSQERFDQMLPAWKEAIESGKKSPEQVIASVSTRATLTEAMKETIASIKKPVIEGEVV